jgi:hypothetical protein
MDIAEKMAADIALAMDGGEWKDGKWYSKFHRDAWIKAVKPYADKIERLREEHETVSRIVDGMTLQFVERGKEIERLRGAKKLERQLRDDALRAFIEARAALKESE